MNIDQSRVDRVIFTESQCFHSVPSRDGGEAEVIEDKPQRLTNRSVVVDYEKGRHRDRRDEDIPNERQASYNPSD